MAQESGGVWARLRVQFQAERSVCSSLKSPANKARAAKPFKENLFVRVWFGVVLSAAEQYSDTLLGNHAHTNSILCG